MNYYIGTDIESISRFKRLWEKKAHLLHKIFFKGEINQVKSLSSPPSSLAGIWCAKEAVLKAFAPILTLEIRQIEITKNPKGFPEALIHHPTAKSLNFHLSISISHTKELASATALLQVY